MTFLQKNSVGTHIVERLSTRKCYHTALHIQAEIWHEDSLTCAVLGFAHLICVFNTVALFFNTLF